MLTWMASSEASDRKPFDALHALLVTARELAKTLVDDPQLERLVRAFRLFPERDREAILQVIEKDASWRRIVADTGTTTGITVRPNPHASLYVHVLNAVDETMQRDADVIRRGLETFVQMLPLLFQDGVHEQWTAAAHELARTTDPAIIELLRRLMREVTEIIGPR
jgi:hypothetical protein